MPNRAIRLGSLASALLLAAAATWSPGAGAAGYAPVPEGVWLSEKGKVAVRFYNCADQICGRIVWMAKPYRKSGELRRDEKNPDPSLRDRSWCGMQVIEGLRAGGGGIWEGGAFYYPKDGNTYSLDVEPAGADQLTIHAYLGIRLLGKSETWTRAEEDPTFACPAES